MFSKTSSVLVLSCALFSVALAMDMIGGPQKIPVEDAEQLLTNTFSVISSDEENGDIK